MPKRVRLVGTAVGTVETLNPFESIENAIAFSPHDWGEHSRLAWVYGIAAGWDSASIKELSAKFGWGTATLARLRLLRLNYRRAHRAWKQPHVRPAR